MCRDKMKAWTGWIYFSKDGKDEVPFESLPKRKNRGKKVNLYVRAHVNKDPRLVCWR